MAFNASVIKDSGNTIINGARVETVTAQGSTCLEFVAQDTDRDGILAMNRDASIEVGITLIADPDGLQNNSTPTTAQAWATRIAKITPNTTELIDVKAGTRVLFSSASGTPQVAILEVNS
jgi:hypothetical protein